MMITARSPAESMNASLPRSSSSSLTSPAATVCSNTWAKRSQLALSSSPATLIALAWPCALLSIRKLSVDATSPCPSAGVQLTDARRCPGLIGAARLRIRRESQRQRGGVVGLPLELEVRQCGLERPQQPLGRPGRMLDQHPTEPVAAEAARFPQRVDHAVGVDEQGLVGLERHCAVDPVAVGPGPEDRALVADLANPPVLPHE